MKQSNLNKKFLVIKNSKIVAEFKTKQDAQQYIYLQENKHLYYIIESFPILKIK